MAYPTLTPHLPGTPAARPGLSPGILPARLLRQLQAVCRSGVVCACELRLFTPLQHAGVRGPRPLM
ncbi:hypothetical protein IEQ34_013527 [Dendrobium chrysotoxum]|uniref:Uncharacterized protein n=1 Tax=Dendrobium chrysotoxum TaxID=161865 RepID=A0AAV7GP50_DENCH|nr:hypothetical protein IEQ34_012793 [Dendrobium chrysotoxum]KAH0458212.1 hypothetical protein IEQ34_013527 [Dendrobium chrysotoxum]